MPSPFSNDEMDIIIEREKRFVISRGQRWWERGWVWPQSSCTKELSGGGGSMKPHM